MLALVYCHLEQASLAMGRACFCFVYRTRNITFLLYVKRASNAWFMAYKTRNVTFEARLLWYVAHRTKNITFETRFWWFMAIYRTRNVTFEVRLFWFMHIEQGIFLLNALASLYVL